MANDTEPARGSEESEPPPRDVDFLLEWWVGLANRTREMAVGVTLDVSGQVITGQLIGGWEFFDRLAELLESASGAEVVAEHMAPELRELADSTYGPEATGDNRITSYVHLRDAHRLAGDQWVPDIEVQDGMLWRGQLSMVSGWSMGSFGPVRPPTLTRRQRALQDADAEDHNNDAD